jgi:hypothetical protein
MAVAARVEDLLLAAAVWTHEDLASQRRCSALQDGEEDTTLLQIDSRIT